MKATYLSMLFVILCSFANAQKEFIDSIRFMLVDLNGQIQCKPVNELLQHTIPYCSGDTMNDSLEANLRQLISDDYLFRRGLFQEVSSHVLQKYSVFIPRIIAFFLQAGTDSEYKDNMMWMAIVQMRIPSTEAVSHLENAKKILLQLEFTEPYSVARVLYYLGEAYAFLSKPDSSNLMYRQSLLKNQNKTREEKILYATTLLFMADKCRERNKPDSALLLFQQQLELCKIIYGEKSAEYAYWLIQVTDRYIYMAKYNLALSQDLKALAITQTTLGEQSNQYAVCQAEIGEIYYCAGEYAKALPYSQRALDIKRKIFGNDYFDNVVNLHDLAMLYIRTGLYNEAVPLLNESLNISKKYFGEQTGFAFDLCSLAEVYENLGEYEKALPLYQEALLIQGKIAKHDFYYTRILYSIASLFTKLCQYDKAIAFFRESLQLRKEGFGEMTPEYCKILNSCAKAYLLKGDYRQALLLQQQSLNINRKLFGDTHPDIAAGLYNLATLYYYENNFKKAEDYCDSALQLQTKVLGPNHPDLASSYDLNGNINQKLHRYNAALKYYQQAFEIRKNIMNKVHPDYINSLYNLGMIYVKKGQVADAAKLLMQADSCALVHIEDSYASLSEEEKLIYLHNRENQFQYLPSLLYLHKTNDPEIVNRVYSNAIALKSMVLFHQQEVYNSIRKSKDSTALQMYNEWRFNKAFLGQQILLPPQKRVSYFDSLNDATTQMEEQLTRISLTFRNNTLHQTTVAEDLIQNLSKNEAAVEFIRFRLYNTDWTDSVIYAALVLLPGSNNVKFVPLFEERQLKTLMRFTNNTGEAAVSYLYPPADQETEVSRKLYRFIWRPMDSLFNGIHTIYFSPCGLLYKLSFAALHSPGKKLLIDNYNIKQVLCTRNLAWQVGDANNFTTASLWGDINYNGLSTSAGNVLRQYDSANFSSYGVHYDMNGTAKYSTTTAWQLLPGTKKETEKIFQLMMEKNIACKMEGQGFASEEEFKKMDGNSPGLLHIATHGFFFQPTTIAKTSYPYSYDMNSFSIQQNPMFRSGLLLAGANAVWSGDSTHKGAEDGVLTAYEISQLDLSNTQLVTLSACETALGDIEDNEGVFGLQRAFKMAGAGKILMSLWKVPDEQTTQLMLLFYSSLLQGNDANTALRNADLVMKKNYSPYYWAGFVLTE